MNNTTKYILIGAAVLLVAIIIFLNEKSKKQKESLTCYDLPTSVDPRIFGPSYWKSLHDVVHKIPCGVCRTFSEKFMIYFHDVINKKLKKPVYDQKNYDEIKQYLQSL